jgi:hypothetical protein
MSISTEKDIKNAASLAENGLHFSQIRTPAITPAEAP